MTDVLAIVGGRSFVDVSARAEARAVILGVFERRRPDLVVSGGAQFIDKLAVDLAREHGIAVREHLPQVPRWDGPGGYEERNALIARDCTRLLRIACRWVLTNGSGWTADEAEKLGATVWRVSFPASVASGTLYAPLTTATIGAVIKDGVVVEVPPYGKRMGWKGRDVDPLVKELLRQRVKVRWIPAGW